MAGYKSRGCDAILERKPSFKMVLTAVGDMAYTRPKDGVIVCPISALKP